MAHSGNVLSADAAGVLDPNPFVSESLYYPQQWPPSQVTPSTSPRRPRRPPPLPPPTTQARYAKAGIDISSANLLSFSSPCNTRKVKPLKPQPATRSSPRRPSSCRRWPRSGRTCVSTLTLRRERTRRRRHSLEPQRRSTTSPFTLGSVTFLPCAFRRRASGGRCRRESSSLTLT